MTVQSVFAISLNGGERLVTLLQPCFIVQGHVQLLFSPKYWITELLLLSVLKPVFCLLFESVKFQGLEGSTFSGTLQIKRRSLPNDGFVFAGCLVDLATQGQTVPCTPYTSAFKLLLRAQQSPRVLLHP